MKPGRRSCVLCSSGEHVARGRENFLVASDLSSPAACWERKNKITGGSFPLPGEGIYLLPVVYVVQEGSRK